MRFGVFVSCLFFLAFMLVLSLLPVMAHATTNSTITLSDVAPSSELISTMGGTIGGGLALIWAMRKIIKFLNKS